MRTRDEIEADLAEVRKPGGLCYTSGGTRRETFKLADDVPALLAEIDRLNALDEHEQCNRNLEKLNRTANDRKAALGVAEAAREAATSRANRHRQTGDEWMLRATVAEAALAQLGEPHIEYTLQWDGETLDLDEAFTLEQVQRIAEREGTPDDTPVVMQRTRYRTAWAPVAAVAPAPEPPHELSSLHDNYCDEPKCAGPCNCRLAAPVSGQPEEQQ